MAYPGCDVRVVVSDGVDSIVVLRRRRPFSTQVVPATHDRPRHDIVARMTTRRK